MKREAEPLRVLDLFSGIGGFSLGLERTGGFKTVAFCEIEKFPRRVLAKHWPDVPIHRDVKELKAEHVGAVDVICGGFPCQDISVAGLRAGIAGERSGLWSEIARLVGEIEPSYVLVENVANLLSGPGEQPGAWFGRVLGDLAALRYDAEWHSIPASYFGADHLRDRVWIIAYPDRQRFTEPQVSAEPARPILDHRAFDEIRRGCRSFESGMDRTANGLPGWLDRIHALGNAVVPQIPELLGRAILAAESERVAA